MADLPKDIHPDSRCRLPLVERAALDADAQRIYDNLNDPNGTSHVGLRGPGGIRLWSPGIARHTQAINAYYREGGCPLSLHVREVTTLITAREFDSQFEWAAHERVARKAGVSEATIEAIRQRKPTAGLPEEDAAIIELGRETFGRHNVSAETYARAETLFGRHGLCDIVCLMGQYAATAALLCAFGMQLPEGQEPLLPV